MRSIDSKFIKLAEKIANTSSCKYKHGAVLVRGKEIISIGVNRSIGFDKILTQFGFAYTLHAELDVIRKTYSIPSNSTLYVARKKFKMSKPCDKCLSIINNTNIVRIVFSNEKEIQEIKI